MKTVQEVQASIDSFSFGYGDESGEWVELELFGDFKEHAKALKCSEELLEAIVTSFDFFKDMVKEDLEDIWNQE